ncbi:hypothetical protein VC83_04466 [Pseudogymnoascus destructans]|uniref:Uncharacterized protein n=2 Tax=Pseudogymnoascus destructans TaxID=655981 RepID=L8G1D4_PSED2|nr:uncharacterized protein VC83_04466 [Pseudogymnoascus destructans]ELR05761.1 hypothetical protein GMDG_01839 [Pseudogymnoascus destructans 20631-21]OAF59063.1 hypothetical protein VC83_04466 [Pseudogymnoascus destructans]
MNSSSSSSVTEASCARMRPLPVHPSRLLPHQQMHREGPVPRAPGEREPDFYERMTPRNQRLTQLYVFAAVASAVGLYLLVWSLGLIKSEKLFSEAAKTHLLASYEWAGYGLVVAALVATVLLSFANILRILSVESPLPEIYAAAATAAISALVVIFGIISYSTTVNAGAEDGIPYDVCTAPGADPWKRLPCNAASKKRLLVQLGGLICAGAAAILCFLLCVLHVSEFRNERSQGGLYVRTRGYTRLSLNPYEVQDEDEDVGAAGPSVHLK